MIFSCTEPCTDTFCTSSPLPLKNESDRSKPDAHSHLLVWSYIVNGVSVCMHAILMSALASPETYLWKFSTLVMFLDISSTILWRCKQKSPQNGNKKAYNPLIYRNIIHMTYITFIFLKVFWIRTKTVNVRGKNSINILSKWTIRFWLI